MRVVHVKVDAIVGFALCGAQTLRDVFNMIYEV